MDLSQETPKKEVKCSFSEVKTRSQCFLTFFMYGTQRKWRYLYSTLAGTRGASSSMVGPLRAEVVPVPHTCNPFPAHRCQLGSSAQGPSKYDLVTYACVEKAFW